MRFTANVNLSTQTIVSQKIDGVAGTWLDSITQVYSVAAQRKYNISYTSAGLTNIPVIILDAHCIRPHQMSIGDATGASEIAPSNTQCTVIATAQYGSLNASNVISITLISQD